MIALEKIIKEYGEPNGTSRIIFDELEFNMSDDVGSVAILGRSGSGKTTLLSILAGLDTNYEGSYFYHGHLLSRSNSRMAHFRKENIGYITQNYRLLDDRTVVQNVVMGVRGGKNKLSRAHACLEQVGLVGYGKRRTSQLSGGEAQRVAIARALAKEPRIVIADEPSGALDEKTEGEILDLFDELQSEGVKFVIATHNNLVANRCDLRYGIERQRLKVIG